MVWNRIRRAARNVTNRARDATNRARDIGRRVVRRVRERVERVARTPVARNVINTVQRTADVVRRTARSAVRRGRRAVQAAVSAGREHFQDSREVAAEHAAEMVDEASEHIDNVVEIIEGIEPHIDDVMDKVDIVEQEFYDKVDIVEQGLKTAAEAAGVFARPPDLPGLTKIIEQPWQTAIPQLPVTPDFKALTKIVMDVGRPAAETARILNALHKFIYGYALHGRDPEELTDDDVILLAEVFFLPDPFTLGAVAVIVGKAKISWLATKIFAVLIRVFPAALFAKGGKGIRILEAMAGHALTKKTTIAAIAKFAVTNPKKAWSMFKYMGADKKLAVFKAMGKIKGGDAAITLIQKAVFAAAPLWLKILKGAPIVVITLSLIMAVVWGMPFMVDWRRKEIPEPIGMTVWAAIEAEEWELAQEANKAYREYIVKVNEQWIVKLVDKHPVFGPWFKLIAAAQLRSADLYDKIIAASKPIHAEITVIVRPGDVYVYFNGAREFVRDRWRFLLTPGKYRIEAKKDGYISEVIEIELKIGDDTTISFDLEEGPPGLGTITLDSSPSAEIWIMGLDSGFITPHTFTFVPGRFDVEFRVRGHRSEVRTLWIREGDNDPVSVILQVVDLTKRDIEMAYVSIYVDPIGAFVFVDGIITRFPSPTHIDLKPGTYELTIRKARYLEKTDTITVAAGGTYRLEYVLERAAPPVVEEEPAVDVWYATIETIPTGGRTFIDGSLWKFPAPTKIPLLAGTYDFRFTLRGHKDVFKTITIP